MKTALLYPPTKQTEDLNWTKPLSGYLASIFGSSAEYKQDVESFNKLRKDFSLCNADKTGISLCFQYFSQLELLDLRVPMDVVSRLKSFQFTWSDAFSPSSKQLQKSLAFEKACVLFNLAALMTKVASTKYRTSTDDSSFKEAIQMLLQASGVFTFIGENFLNGPSSDLRPSTVKFCSSLCLAQNQEIFTLKVIDGDLEQKKNSIISKLCSSTCKHYQDCYSMIENLQTVHSDDDPAIVYEDEEFDDENPDISRSAVSGNLESSSTSSVSAGIDPSWVATIQLKALYYQSLAYYFHGLQMEASSKYGEAIGYLQRSAEILGQIQSSTLRLVAKTSTENVYELLDNYKYQKDAVDIKLKELIKENDLIYNDLIPPPLSITEPKPMNSAKPIEMSKIELFSQINERSFNNFLKNVVPMDIHELLSFYSEEKSQFLRTELDEVDVSNEELSSALEFLNLPKALVAIKEVITKDAGSSQSRGTVELPEDILSKVDDVEVKYSEDVGNKTSIFRLREEILNCVKLAEAELAKNPYSNGGFRDDLVKLKKSLFDASTSDSRLFDLVDKDYSKLYEVLAKGRNSEDFKNLFEVKVSESTNYSEISLLDMDDTQLKTSGSVEAQIKNLEDVLNSLNVIKSNKKKLVDALKTEIHKDDISDILMFNTRHKSANEIKTVIFPDELKKFNVFLEQLDKLIGDQKKFIKELNDSWTQLSTDPKVKKASSSSEFRNNLYVEQLNRISKFYENWKKYNSGLARGVGFYQQLASYASNLKNAIEREISEKSQMERREPDFNSSFASMNLNSMNQPNPPQPQVPPRTFPSQVAQQPTIQPQFSGFGNQNVGPALPPKMGSFSNRSGPVVPNTEFQRAGSLGSNFSYESQQNYQSQQPNANQQFLNQQAYPNQQFPNQQFLNQQAYPNQQFPNQQYPNQQAPIQRQNSDRSSNDGLIYDQPSAYQPNMYSFFLKGN